MPRFPDLASIPLRVRSLLVGHALASVVLVASLVLVLWYWRNAQERGLQEAETAFHATSEEAVELLRQRLISYELLVRGGASLQASLPQPSRLQWQRYVSGLDIGGRFASVQALGFAIAVDPDQLGALREALPGIDPARADDTRSTGGSSAIVLYLAPEQAVNQRAIGADLARHPARHDAMELAMIAGDLRMSALVPAIGGAGDEADQLAIFAPVYAAGAPPEVGRREALRGWVFAQMHVPGFVDQALRTLERRHRMRIVDISTAQEAVIHVDPEFGAADGKGTDPDRRPAFTHSELVEAMGRRWRVEFESPTLAAMRAGIPGLTATLVSGLLGSLLIFGIAFTLARTRSRAEALAERMTESYRRSEQRFRSAMRYSAIGKALLDHQGDIIEANPALAQILGSTPQALVGTPLWQHFAEGQDETVRTLEREALGDGAYRTTRRLRRRDGEVRHASLVFAAVPGETDEDFASLVQVEDVTERLRAEARVRALNRTLEARVALRTRELSLANRELEAFAYSVSHDLRAPLRSIDGFSRLLSERHAASLDDSGLDYLDRIRSAAVRMGELIDALLKMSRVSRGEMKRDRVDLGRLAREIDAEMRNAEPGRKVDLEVDPDLLVRGDPALLRNLMANLLDNAWKFTRECEDARIVVGRGGQGEYFVRDNGAGFSAEYADKLFRPFQRLHSESEFTGHGIGLATVKRIVERHGGSIRAEAAPGRGATFWFTLPDERADA